MIQDIYPHKLDNHFIPNNIIGDNDFIFYFQENSLLLKKDDTTLSLPQKKDLKGCPSEGIFLITLDNTPCFLIWECEVPDNTNYIFHEVKFPHVIIEKEIDWASVVALQLRNWYSQNKFCGICGSKTIPKTDERAIYCPSCKTIHYPKISPAIIVAITKDDKLLMAHNANFPENFYSIIAGFVDVGETIEEAVKREVKEEVGITVKNIHYYKSQPWAYSGSLMIGFIAETDDEQIIHIDNKEIKHADWYTKDQLPEHPTNRSIAGELIDKFKNGTLL